jgi:hypothetical protein
MPSKAASTAIAKLQKSKERLADDGECCQGLWYAMGHGGIVMVRNEAPVVALDTAMT